MLKKLAEIIAQIPNYASLTPDGLVRHNGELAASLVSEFNANTNTLIDLAYSAKPNMISLITEFEKIRHRLQAVPNEEDIDRYSCYGRNAYTSEFGSLDQLVGWIGQDDNVKEEHGQEAINPNLKGMGTRELENRIKNALEDMPDMLDLFENLKDTLPKCDPRIIRRTANDLRAQS
ncbi:MAG: hypothetical protein MPK30_05985 [Gammaproteobacteria bacterium]|nr:hypothetical protein [Gammaproteobacteria bacterium]